MNHPPSCMGDGVNPKGHQRWHLRQQAPRICTGGAGHLLQKPQSSLFVALAPTDLWWRKGCPYRNWMELGHNPNKPGTLMNSLSTSIYYTVLIIQDFRHWSLHAERLPFFGDFSGPNGWPRPPWGAGASPHCARHARTSRRRPEPIHSGSRFSSSPDW